MPHQPNYVEILPTKPQSFSVSRIAESEADTDILTGRIPGEFGFDYSDNVELHFYDSQNTLVNSTVVPISTGIISSRTVILPNNQKEEKLVIDMTRVQNELGLFLVPGSYTVVINLFADEIGSYGNKKLAIEQISDSRTELRLSYNVAYSDVENQELYEFAEPSLPRVIAAGSVGSVIGIGQDTLLTDQTVSQIQSDQFITDVNTQLINAIPTLPADLYNIDANLQNDLNTTITLAGAAVYDAFVALLDTTKNSNKFDRLQKEELDVLIQQAVQNAFTEHNLGLLVNGRIQLVPIDTTITASPGE